MSRLCIRCGLPKYDPYVCSSGQTCSCHLQLSPPVYHPLPELTDRQKTLATMAAAVFVTISDRYPEEQAMSRSIDLAERILDEIIER